MYVLPSKTWRGPGRYRSGRGRCLRRCIAVAGPDIKEAVGTERETAAVVVEVAFVDFEQHAFGGGVGAFAVGVAVNSARRLVQSQFVGAVARSGAV